MRFRRRPILGRALRPRLHPFRRRLRQAHRWMETGRPADAAQSFDELAQTALDHDRPIASQLFIQAGRAYLAAGNLERAELTLTQGIRLMIEQDDPRLGPVAQRLAADLRGGSHSDLADAIQQLLPPPLPAVAHQTAKQRTHALPAKCPYCGGSVHSDQVDRTDPERPACAYCGSPLVGAGPADD